MSREYSMVPVESSGELIEFPVQPSGESRGEMVSPLKMFLSAMRGRWLWASGLGLALGAVGAAAGYLLPSLTYQAESVIAIQLWQPPVMFDTAINFEVKNPNEYVEQQAARIESQPVLEAALTTPVWQAAGVSRSLYEFMRRMDVVPDRGRISIRYTDASPQAALAGTQALVDAYMNLHGKRAQELEALERITKLSTLASKLDNDRRNEIAKRARMAAENEFLSEDLSQFIAAQQRYVVELETQLRSLDLTLRQVAPDTPVGEAGAEGAEGAEAVVTAEGTGGDAADAEPGAAEVATEAGSEPLTAEQWANELDDIETKNLLQVVTMAEQTVRRLAVRLGPNHRDVRDAQTTAEFARERMAEHVALLNERLAAGTYVSQTSTGGLDPARLARQAEQIRALLADEMQDLRTLSAQQQLLAESRENESQIVTQYRDTNTQIARLQFEGREGVQRVDVLNPGTLPILPVRDRRVLASVAGGIAGMGLGIGLVLLVGLFDRRLRSHHDAEDRLSQVAMLGILPQLPDDPADPDQARLTAHSVHQIRTMLQVSTATDGGQVLTITSANPLDGKTSLTLALGMSFAASGARTILVDCDLVRGGLTSRVGSIQRRKIGQILQRQQLVTGQQVEQALRLAQESGRMLGEVLIELGHLTQEDLDSALRMQEGMTIGVFEALEGEPLEGCVAPTGIENLFVLPLGRHQLHQAFRLSPRAIADLFRELRQRYDVILVDTGPVPASIEATHAAVASDGVVLVASRGEQRQHVELAISRLKSLGATITGLVFNRATGGDLRDLAESSYARGSLAEATVSEGDTFASQSAHRFGPIARTVAGITNGAAQQRDR